MKNFIQIGDVIDHTPATAVASGSVVVIGERVGIAIADIVAGQPGALRVRGVVELTKVSGTAFAQGDTLYWDASGNRLTKTDTGNTAAGYAAAPAPAGVTVARLHLNA